MERLRRSPLIPQRLRHSGACQACSVLVVLPGLFAFSLASAIIEVCFPTLHAWPRQRRERRNNRKMEKGFRDKFGDPDEMTADSDIEMQLLRPVVRTVIVDDAGGATLERPQKKGFFDILPAEIRRQIMMDAFGDNIIHIDLQYRYPYRTLSFKEPNQHTEHAVHDAYQRRGNKSAGEKEWRWWSCVCHHVPPETNPVWMSHGRRALPTKTFAVSCLEGISQCEKWQGTWPSKCHVGVMGWMLSCKQAYFEATDILYTTNTFNLQTPVLLRTFHSIITSQMRTQLTSLILDWDLSETRLTDGFSYTSFIKWSPSGQATVFPSLKYLRVALAPFVHGHDDVLDDLGLPTPLWADKSFTLRRVHEGFYPCVEGLLHRIAPAGTEITLTMSDWDMYEIMDKDLVARQGRERAKLQRSEYGGLKCWKDCPRVGQSGYWIHIGTDFMRLDQTRRYDWERHRMYNLGPEKYECTGGAFWRNWENGFVLEAW